jgi:hypothetical protein
VPRPEDSGCRNDKPVPGTFAVKFVPRLPAVTRKGPTPTDVDSPLGDSVNRTPGNGENDLRKRHTEPPDRD